VIGPVPLLPAINPGPCRLDRVAERRDQAKAGDDDSTFYNSCSMCRLRLSPILAAVPFAINGLYLCDATIHKQFNSRDVAAVVGGEKHHGLRDLIGGAEPAERNSIGNHLRALLARF
jgi:hypothetical protein